MSKTTSETRMDAGAQTGRSWLKAAELVALAVLFGGLIMAIFTYVPHDPDGFWADYIVGARLAGWTLFMLGIILLAFAVARHRLDFFDTDKKIGSDAFGVSLVSIVVVAGFLIWFAVRHLPSTPPGSIKDPKEAAQVLGAERNLKAFVSALIAAGAIGMAYFPWRRFVGK